ncbi:DUF1735 domain-containing protein [Mucilaginibacter sp.]|uniref:DUF1735 domain-containing protein n=1 Tax=Mucilaginibacter sp. TaxID=1882438 RepID=UPI00261EE93B|nr:DUF1735 domain-containing protein [Mucilaginibacter sp.]MDB5031017.1 hypothetical protein [Mucilaginibacter sp.]
MKTKYLKRITMTSFAAVMLLFSSCLKDNRYFNAETVPNLAELPKSGTTFFANDAITKAGVDTITFAVGVTAAEPPATATAVTLGVDNSVITTYNAANPAIVYQPIPAAALKFTSAVTIPAGKNSTLTSLIIDRTLLDPAVSYMLPVKIISASGLPLSANFNLHYYHIIGNDFAGPYTHDFVRTPAGGNFTGRTDIFSPDSPTQFEVVGGYFTADVRYLVKFTKTGTGASATYSNFAISINAADVAYLTANGISITAQPQINGYTAGSSYTYAQALQLFANGFTYQVLGGSGARTNLDLYHRP